VAQMQRNGDSGPGPEKASLVIPRGLRILQFVSRSREPLRRCMIFEGREVQG